MKSLRKMFAVASLTTALAATSCTESKRRVVNEADKQALKSHVSTTAPTPKRKLDGAFGDAIELIGVDVSPAIAKPGEPTTVTWHWKVNKAVGPGYELFTHVADAEGRDRLNQDGEGVIRRAYPPGEWKAGEYIRDEQRVVLPANWDSSRATFYVGIYKGSERLAVKRGASDGNNRMRALTIPTGAKSKPEGGDLPELVVGKVHGTITLDGKLDEADWQTAGKTARLVNTMTGAEAGPETYVRALWTAEKLYVGWEVKDTFLKSTFANNEDHLWEQDAVEIMVDPDGDGRNYFEIQVAPTGKSFDTRYETRRKPEPFGIMDWSSQIEAKVHTEGTVNDGDDDTSYTVELAMPWSAFGLEGAPITAPRVGSNWRVNFYVMDTGKDGRQDAAGWSPPRVGDFHVPARFGRLRFAEKANDPAPAAGPARLPEALRDRLKGPLVAPRITPPDPDEINRPRRGETVPSRPEKAP